MVQPYPQAESVLKDKDAVLALEWLQEVIVAIRTIRSERNIAPGKPLAVLFRKGKETDKTYYKTHHDLCHALAKIESAAWLSDEETPPPSASAFVGDLEIFVPLAGFLDKAEEISRLQREIIKLEKDLATIHNKLNNPQFVDKAPPMVVEKERARLNELSLIKEKLLAQIEEIEKF